MRKSLAEALHKEMAENKDIYFITCDLGYKLWDKIREDYPDRFINAGASEFAAMGIAIGLALSGKIPFIYSITPFLLYRPFEIIRNYIDKYSIPVKLLGGGRDQDYHIDGFSHDASDIDERFRFRNIMESYPEDEKDIVPILKNVIGSKKPYFISLKK